MGSYIIRRLLIMVPTVALIAVLTFIVVELPPGDYASRVAEAMEQRGENIDMEYIQAIRELYRLDDPTFVRFFRWLGGFMTGDMGYSIEYRMPVRNVFRDRFPITILLSIASMLFTWAVAFPIGLYSAVRQYSFGDYFWSVVGFIGLSVPNFLLALVLMFYSAKYFGGAIGGLFSKEFEDAAWSIPKVVNLMKNLAIPVIVIGTASTAGLIRILRANLLDELKRPYVELARAKGLTERRLIVKYPLRIAINPFLSGAGSILPGLISGAVITEIVLDLPAMGPVFLRAIRAEDMQLVSSYMLILGILTVIGTLLSDLLLAVADPRIRYE
ncbi:MAG: ABC transporter permease [Spirochaetaceae bacterium]|nr:ABC transporter permease [Spirochaetaceae bacterium]